MVLLALAKQRRNDRLIDALGQGDGSALCLQNSGPPLTRAMISPAQRR